VNGANKAAEMLNSIAAGGEDSYVQYWEHKLAFNLSGHALHTMFWNNMKPDGGGEPSGALAEGITKDFGSYANFKRLFQASAGAVEGSGWAILGYDMLSRKLMVYQAGKHMNLNVQSAAPLLVIDVWEHAYYLKYQNKRGEYIDAFFNVINWDDVARRYSVYTHPRAS
jgi:Fe-Mn family superoxide dismutase